MLQLAAMAYAQATVQLRRAKQRSSMVDIKVAEASATVGLVVPHVNGFVMVLPKRQLGTRSLD